MKTKKTKCPRCKDTLVFDTIEYKGEVFLVARCCGSGFSELVSDWGLKWAVFTGEELQSKIAENDFSAYIKRN